MLRMWVTCVLAILAVWQQQEKNMIALLSDVIVMMLVLAPIGGCWAGGSKNSRSY